MASAPLITFKAGQCEAYGDKVKCLPEQGYLYLYSEDDLMHLCWRSRSAPADEPALDLITIPGDATFTPLVKEEGAEDVRSPTNGRIFKLRFSSSGERKFFWLQAKSQHKDGDLDWFSERDQRLGALVDSLLSGEDVDVAAEIEDIRRNASGGGSAGASGRDDNDLMELDRTDTGGAGADATGGDPRDEGESRREGGADGGRAASSSQPQDVNSAVQNFLQSLNGGSSNATQRPQHDQDNVYTTLPDLLSTTHTLPLIDTLPAAKIDKLCLLLPTDLFLLDQESTSSSSTDPTPEAAQAAIEALSLEQKKDILRRVLRSPQLHQSLGSLTEAIRDGGLPMIGEALGLKLENGGLVKGGSVPLGGGMAIEGFVEGLKRSVEEEEAKERKGE